MTIPTTTDHADIRVEYAWATRNLPTMPAVARETYRENREEGVSPTSALILATFSAAGYLASQST